MSTKLNTALLLLAISTGSIAADLPDLRILEAARNQDQAAVQMLLAEKRPPVNSAQKDGTTALAWAVYHDNVAMASLLIDKGAEADTANDLGVSPLMLACDNRNAGMVRLLLEAGADPNKAFWNGVTPLMNATRSGNAEITGLLLEHGADINRRDPRRNQSALMWAISFGQPAIARILIEHGADVNASSTKLTEKTGFQPMLIEGYGANVEGIAQGGYTPLMFAARRGDLDTTRLLIDKGARVNDVSAEDGSALVIASAYGHEQLALHLLENNADPAQADANGMTALHYAMRDGLKLLHGYKTGAVPHVCGFGPLGLCKPLETLDKEELAKLNEAGSALTVVEDGGEKDANEILPGDNMLDLAEALLARGADPNAAMKYPPPRMRLDSLPWLNLTGATPIFLASASNDLSAMDLLMEHGANPLITTTVNDAVFEKQTKAHADDNQIYGNGTTLMVAAGLGRKNDFTEAEQTTALQAAKRLVELGADVNLATATGWTALHAAAFLGADSVIRFLVEKGAVVNVRNGCGQTPLSLAQGSDVTGLINRARPHESTVTLLRDLGANDNASEPVGKCVLGRGGLEVDIETKKEVQQARQKIKAE